MRDLQSHRWMWIKAGLFLVIGVVACALILTLVYVIEKYVDPGYRFSGLISALRYLCGKR